MRPGRAIRRWSAIWATCWTASGRWKRAGEHGRRTARRTAMADMDIHQVLQYLPQRFPILMVDRVLECEPGKRIVALKNVSVNEPYFPGHFPLRPVMPGVLILEAMAQAAAILVFRTLNVKPDEKA